MTEQQFSPLAERYMDTVFRVAYSYLRSPADADDVTQDVLLQLYKTDKAFDDDAHVKNWLIRVTVNRCKNVLRARGTGRRTSPTTKTVCPSRSPSATSCLTR